MLGFSLKEIREFLSLRTNDLGACTNVQKMLDHKLRDVRTRRIARVKSLILAIKTSLGEKESSLDTRIVRGIMVPLMHTRFYMLD